MKIAVRLDDITPDMDWPKFLRFKALLDKYKIKPLIGIVPENKDDVLKGSDEGAPEDYYSYIKGLEADGWTLSMHGYQHVYSTKKGGLFPLNNFSEFAGVEYEKQLQMITDGKEILRSHGIETDIFMAPGHSYDRNTVKALLNSGFTTLTDGFAKTPVIYRGMRIVPISFKMSRTFKNAMAQKEGYSTIIIHTGMLKDEEFDKYDNIFNKENIDFVSYSELLKAPTKARGEMGHIKEYWMAKFKYIVRTLISR